MDVKHLYRSPLIFAFDHQTSHFAPKSHIRMDVGDKVVVVFMRQWFWAHAPPIKTMALVSPNARNSMSAASNPLAKVAQFSSSVLQCL